MVQYHLFLKKKIYKNGIMFIPGDMPLISIKDFEKLMNTFVQKKIKSFVHVIKRKLVTL